MCIRILLVDVANSINLTNGDISFIQIKTTVNEKTTVSGPGYPFCLAARDGPDTITVTGKVTDEKGAAVAGATVTEKGTRNATTTLDDGTFTIQGKIKSKAPHQLRRLRAL
jgi:hypothetical protein